MARAFSEPMSMARAEGAAITAGPVMKPWAMKSRRVVGRLWLSCLIGSFRPSVRGLFLRMYMLSSPLLNQRRAAAEDGTARCFHDRTGATAGARPWGR